uniref:Uncharacterized protein TCIL3000_3_1770 n=1 Tax=Trypanosoma congolense (strain IL3000) TaxID=1068625 RepID=G0UK42_TRYCI|nr:unnamed protein product [Trypanosoma congolense IL3000]
MTETGDVLFYVGIAERVGKHRDLMKFPVQSRAVESSHYLNTRETAILRDISFSQLSLPDRKPYYIIGQGTDCASLVNSSKCYYEHFGGQKGLIYDKYSGFVVPLDSVVEARVFGDPTERMPHPFHAHVNHFVFVSFVPRKGGHHENVSLLDYGIFPGDIRDTIPILDGVTTIRWRAATYAGEVVYHCHTLTHEDRGMMTSYLVYQDNASAPSPDVLHPVGYDSITTRRRRQIFLLLFVFFFTATVVSTVFSCIRAEPPGSMRAKHEPLNVPRVETKNALSDLECVPLVRRPGL